jgi:tRNA threonylcarbamoyladenosine biosynthesis protein TsaE
LKKLSRSRDQTIAIGRELAARLRPGDVVALIGGLGAGKTVLTKGIASGLGVKDVRYVTSPTFVIIKEYGGKIPLYHLDLYRLEGHNILDSLSWEEYFYGGGVTVIEWADKVRDLLPKRYIEVRLSITGENERWIEIRNISRRENRAKRKKEIPSALLADQDKI